MKKIINAIFIFITTLLFGSFLQPVSADVTLEHLDEIYLGEVHAIINVYNDDIYSYLQYRYQFNGKTAYCIEPNVHITTSYYYPSEDLNISRLSAEQIKRIQLIAYYGYDYYDHQTTNYYIAAQELIWETELGSRGEVYWTTGDQAYDPKIDVEHEKSVIENLIANHTKTVSFNGNNIKTTIGKELTLTDTNNVLGTYEIISSDVEAKINGNSLIINANKVTDNGQIRLKRKEYANSPTILYYNGESQKMLSSGFTDPSVAVINIQVIGGKVTIQKQDKDTLKFVGQGDALLSNAKYGVFKDDGTKVSEIITSDDGTATSDFLPFLGRGYVQEISPSLGYRLDKNTKYWFEITENNLYPKLIVKEDVIDRKVNIFKVFASNETGFLTSEPNIKFDIYLKSTNTLFASITTDENGKASVILPYGKYIVKQVTTSKDHYKVDDFEITIDKDLENDLDILLSNSEIQAKLKLIKVDSNSKQVLVRDGIKFKIKNLDTGKYVCQNVTYPNEKQICTFETKGGYFITPYMLPAGNYQIEELEDQIIDGYIWNSTPLKFSIGSDSKFIYDDNYGLMLEIKFENQQVKGEVEINKYGEELVIENNSYYYKEIKLDGVIYELYAEEDIYSADGTLVYHKGDLVGTYKTKDGYFKVTGLFLGKYYFLEKTTIGSHVLDTNKHSFELKYKDQYTDIISLSFTYKNYLAKSTFEFTKQDLVTGDPLPNTKIQIFTNNEGEERQLIFEGYTDENGKIIIKDLFVSKFVLFEVEAPEGYILNSEPMEFEITKNGEIVKADMTNEKIVEVPNTGLSNINYEVIGSIVLMVSGIGLICYGLFKKKKK